MDVVGSRVDLEHLLKGHDGRLYPRGAHRLLARVFAPYSVHGDSYRRQEARVGRYDTMRSREYSGACVPLNINTSRVGDACCLLFMTLCCEACHGEGTTNGFMLQMAGWTWASTPKSQIEECQRVAKAVMW